MVDLGGVLGKRRCIPREGGRAHRGAAQAVARCSGAQGGALCGCKAGRDEVGPFDRKELPILFDEHGANARAVWMAELAVALGGHAAHERRRRVVGAVVR